MPAVALPRAVRRPLVAVSAAAALAAGATACGSSSGSGEAGGPAEAVPAGAMLYAEAVVRPEGDQRAKAEALLRKVMRTADPGAEIVKLFDKAGDHKLNFARDVDPWLGEKAGIALTRVAPDGEDGAGLAVIDSGDDGKAADRLDSLLGGGTSEAKHGDVEIRTARDRESAAAVTDGHVLVGTPSEVRAGIDVLEGEREALDESTRFSRAREATGSEGIGFFYADVQSLFRATAQQAGPGAALLGPMTESMPDAVSATLNAESDAFVVDGAAVGGGAATAAAASSASADALAAAPADAWLAAGTADIGKSVAESLDSLSGAGMGGIGVEQLESALRAATGLDLRDDVLSWMGNGVAFVSGDSLATLRGGLVVRSTDAGKTATAVRRLGPLLRGSGPRVRELQAPGVDAAWSVSGDGLPTDLLIAAAGDRFVVALGRRALDDALSSDETLGDAPEFRDAAGKLGDEYPASMWLHLPAIAGLVHNLGDGDPDAERVAQTLQTFGPVIAGTQQDGDIARMKLRVAVP